MIKEVSLAWFLEDNVCSNPVQYKEEKVHGQSINSGLKRLLFLTWAKPYGQILATLNLECLIQAKLINSMKLIWAWE